jgi:hypothetical protein
MRTASTNGRLTAGGRPPTDASTLGVNSELEAVGAVSSSVLIMVGMSSPTLARAGS